MAIEFKLPDVGEGIQAGDVVNVLVAEGEVIKANQNVVELETDKAVIELPCPTAGRVVKVHVKAGDKVPVGGTLLTIEPAAQVETHAAKPAPAAEVETAPAVVSTAPPVPPPQSAEGDETLPPVGLPPARETGRRPPPAGPATRKLARKLGVDLEQVSGTGPGGRITAADVENYVKQLAERALAGGRTYAGAPPLPDFSQWGPVERVPVKGIRRKTAEVTSLAWQLIPHVTQFDEADITELEAVRQRYAANGGGVKITVTALALKAAAAALKAYPQVNSSFDAGPGVLVLKKYVHIGVAVDTEHGLVVPVIRDVDRKSVLELARELEATAARARERKLELEEMRGGCFTISNLGGIGGTGFTPIVNYPEVAILGIARAKRTPVFDAQGAVSARLVLPLALSYDHRAIDGADGARFLRKVASLLSDPLALLLEG